MIGLYYSITFSTKKCGKHISRIVSLAANSIVNLCIVCLMLLEEKEITIFAVLLISGLIFICNSLAIIFVNCKFCQCCRYGYHSSIGTINADSISDFKLDKKVEENNKKDITPNDNCGKEYYTPIVDYRSDNSNYNKTKRGINNEIYTPENHE